MTIELSQDMMTDIPELDRQHQELLTRVDVLVQAWAGGRGIAEVEMIIRFLEEHISRHFAREELYMLRYVYSDSAAHKAQHEAFTGSFAGLKERYLLGGVNASLIADMNDLILDWFHNHIRYADRALGLFLRNLVTRQ